MHAKLVCNPCCMHRSLDRANAAMCAAAASLSWLCTCESVVLMPLSSSCSLHLTPVPHVSIALASSLFKLCLKMESWTACRVWPNQACEHQADGECTDRPHPSQLPAASVPCSSSSPQPPAAPSGWLQTLLTWPAAPRLSALLLAQPRKGHTTSSLEGHQHAQFVNAGRQLKGRTVSKSSR